MVFSSVELSVKSKVSHWRLMTTTKAFKSWLQTHHVPDTGEFTMAKPEIPGFLPGKKNESCSQISTNTASAHISMLWTGMKSCSPVWWPHPSKQHPISQDGLWQSRQGLCLSPWYPSVSFVIETNNSFQRQVKVAKWQQCTYSSHHLQSPHT